MVDSSYFSIIAGILCGILSGLGVGGGSLLMVWMTAVLSMDQRLAQQINLMYFIPTALGAYLFHRKQKTIYWKAVIPAALCGCAFSSAAAWFASTIDVSLLRKLFGGFLIVVGIREIRKRPKPNL